MYTVLQKIKQQPPIAAPLKPGTPSGRGHTVTRGLRDIVQLHSVSLLGTVQVASLERSLLVTKYS